jgi:hypothetical protein
MRNAGFGLVCLRLILTKAFYPPSGQIAMQKIRRLMPAM